MEKILHKDMLYTIRKTRVSGFRKSTGSILQSWVKYLTDQNRNTLKITKTIEIHNARIVVRAVFHENKYYPQVFLDE